MLIRAGLVLSAVLVCGAGTGLSSTIYVSKAGSPANDGSSWSKAISDISIAGQVATPGDVILVNDGIYESKGLPGRGNNNVLIITDGVTVRSVHGRESVIIDGGGSNRCVYISGTNAVLEGFSLEHGDAGTDRGGGVYADGYASVTNCYIADCHSTNSQGGGVFMYAGYVDDSIIESNTSYYSGGGVCLNDINSNGGHVRNCYISGNRCGSGGGVGGAGVFGSYAKVEYCLIEENHAQAGDGGGAVVYWSGVVRNCIVSDNYAGGRGGGVYMYYGARVENSTVVSNHSFYQGGGVAAQVGDNKCVNSIIYGNSITTGQAYENNYATILSATIAFDHCCTQPLPAAGSGNIDDNPDLSTVNGYSLNDKSPCINAGNTAAAALPYDFKGNPRVFGGIVDMGAIESMISPRGAISALNLLLLGKK